MDINQDKITIIENKCEFPYNSRQLIMQQPKKLVRNDPYKCHVCGTQLYITIERAASNDLLTSDVMWYLTVSDKPFEEIIQ